MMMIKGALLRDGVVIRDYEREEEKGIEIKVV